MFEALPDSDAPVAETKEQDLANKVLEHFGNILLGEFIVPSAQLRYQKYHDLHLDDP